MKKQHDTISFNNFKSFGEKMQTFSKKPITLVYGPNSMGKSSLLHFLLYIEYIRRGGEQSFTSYGSCFAGDLFDIGEFNNFVHGKDINRKISYKITFKNIEKISQIYGVDYKDVIDAGDAGFFELTDEEISLKIKDYIKIVNNDEFSVYSYKIRKIINMKKFQVLNDVNKTLKHPFYNFDSTIKFLEKYQRISKRSRRELLSHKVMRDVLRVFIELGGSDINNKDEIINNLPDCLRDILFNKENQKNEEIISELKNLFSRKCRVINSICFKLNNCNLDMIKKNKKNSNFFNYIGYYIIDSVSKFVEFFKCNKASKLIVKNKAFEELFEKEEALLSSFDLVGFVCEKKSCTLVDVFLLKIIENYLVWFENIFHGNDELIEKSIIEYINALRKVKNYNNISSFFEISQKSVGISLVNNCDNIWSAKDGKFSSECSKMLESNFFIMSNLIRDINNSFSDACYFSRKFFNKKITSIIMRHEFLSRSIIEVVLNFSNISLSVQYIAPLRYYPKRNELTYSLSNHKKWPAIFFFRC
ncbi:ATP-binding protein [Ectothiorhodospiraceae bacterium BW-2]|nr:ATP-binding protein [Ectothiorhodospiraceae bacterium BW-2]